MSEIEHEWAESLSERERDLALLLANRMNDAVYTKIAFFNMSDKYGRYDGYLSWIVILFAGFLTVGSVWDQVPNLLNFGVAVATGVLSFSATYADFDQRAVEAEKAGDSYNAILKDFQAYYYFVLKDDSYSFEEKKQRLQQLLDRYQEINRNTITTDDDVFEDIDHGDVLTNLETTDEELQTLLSDRRLVNEESDTEMANG